MTVYSAADDIERELARFGRLLRRASVFFFHGLAEIVEIASVREGDDRYDYFVDVSEDDVDIVGARLIDLQRCVRQRFDIEISVLPAVVCRSNGAPGDD